jgi:photosystem II stability/assembly factor-like uncharacterized protein
MKNIYFIMILAHLCIINVNAQWEQVTNNMYGADVSCIVFTDSNIYVGTYGSGIFMSKDKGLNWENISHKMYNIDIIDLAITDGYIFAATEREFQHTSNNGNTWHKIENKNMSDISSVNSKDNFIYAGDRNTGKGFWFSSDYGKNWEQRNNGLVDFSNGIITSHEQIENIECYENNIFAGTYNYLFHSSDNGLNWHRIQYDRHYSVVDEIIKTESEVILLTSRNDTMGMKQRLFKANLNDLIFREFGTELFEEYIRSVSYDKGKLFIATDLDIYLSKDNGLTWKRVAANIENGSIFFRNETLFNYNWNDELYRSTDNGVNFTEDMNGFSGVYVSSLILLNDLLVASTSRGNFASNNLGENWSPIIIDTANQFFSNIIQFKSSSFLSTKNSGIIFSPDNGTTWEKRNEGLGGLFVSKLIKSKNKLFNVSRKIQGISALFYSTNLGLNWIESKINSEKEYFVNEIIGFNDNLFIGTHSEGIFRSTNNGNTWYSCSIGLDDYSPNIPILFALNDKIYAIDYSEGVYESGNMGKSWDFIENSPTQVSCVVVYGNKVFASTSFHGIYKSEDGCKTWDKISTNALLESTWSLIIEDRYLFAGTSNGVWRYKIE